MWFARLRAWARRMVGRDRADRDLNDEIDAYATLLEDELRAAGASRDDARRRARVDLGSAESVKESVRQSRTGAWLEQWTQDVRYALRGLRRSPGFAAAAVLTLGLGIGVNVSLFSIVDSVVFKSLPYERPEDLVELGHHVRQGTPHETTYVALGWPEIVLWRTERAIFTGVEAWRGSREQRWDDRGEPIPIGAFTPGMPALLGIAPRFGRLFTQDEVDAHEPVIVIAEPLWTSAFARRADVIGSRMSIDGRAFTIVGVMPATFRYGPGSGGRALAWTGLNERVAPRVRTVFRMAPGLTVGTATRAAAEVATRMQVVKPDGEPWTPELMPMLSGHGEGLATVRLPMLLLLAAASIVLLVVCLNVAHLLFAGGASRRAELAMRTALGASRARLARMLLTEGMVIATIGGVTATVVAAWTIDLITSIIPVRLGAGLFEVSAPVVDGRVGLFAATVTFLVIAVSAAWPAFVGSRVAIGSTAASPGSVLGWSKERRRTERVLQTAQIALAFLLTTTAALFVTSFVRLVTADLGFDTRGLGDISVVLSEGLTPTPESKRANLAEALARVRKTPGVRSAAFGHTPGWTTAGRLIRAGTNAIAGGTAIRRIGPGYLDTAGIRLVAGREFNAQDRQGSAPVALIDEAGAAQAFPGESPLGKRLSLGPTSQASAELTIVGVVSTVSGTDFASARGRPGLYLAESQETPSGGFIIRADGNLDAALRNVRATLEQFDPAVRIASSGAATDYYETMETYSAPRMHVVLVSTFALLALVTASIGIYGSLTQSVRQRRREIAVRMALGAGLGRLRWMMLRETTIPIAIGLLTGGIAAWWAGGAIGAFLYGIGPRDPIAFAAAAITLAACALVAALGPVHRATHLDPVDVLRQE